MIKYFVIRIYFSSLLEIIVFHYFIMGGISSISMAKLVHAFVVILSCFTFNLSSHSFDNTYALELEDDVTTPHQSKKYPTLEEYLSSLDRKKLCQVVPSLWLKVVWLNPEQFVIDELYFQKVTPKKKINYLVRGFSKKIIFDSAQDSVCNDDGKRWGLWQVTFEEMPDTLIIRTTAIKEFPYEVYDRYKF